MKRLFFAVLLSLTGCTTNTAVEDELSITQGLYGQLTTRCTEADCVGAPNAGVTIAWFDRNPNLTDDAGVGPSPVLQTTSAASGFWEFGLDAGARGYLAIGKPSTQNGTLWFTSISTSVPRGLGRVDWHVGPEDEGTWTLAR